MNTYRLDGPDTSFVFATDGGVPWLVYWGLRLPQSEDLDALAKAQSMDITGGSMDVVAPLSFCPLQRDGFMGQPGLTIADADGNSFVPDLKCTQVKLGSVSQIICESETVRLSINLMMHDDVIRASSDVACTEDCRILWLSAPSLSLPASATNTTEFFGKWCDEFQESTQTFSQGARVRTARGGRPGHEDFPAVLANGSDGCHAIHFAQSGGHRLITEELPDGRRQVQFGMQFDDARLTRHAHGGTIYATMATSRNGVAQNFQRYLRQSMVQAAPNDTARPVHYNCWEAVYFDHNFETLKQIATKAAEFGAERFVLDDGWFGRRDDDTSGLGDWHLDKRKYPSGLSPLIDHVKAQGMGFGIWIEPEMVNPDSDLYRAHPDWALGDPNQALGRNQMALDMSRDEVQDYLFSCFDPLLADHDIEYVKWDHNRMLPHCDPMQAQYALKLLRRLKKNHPNVMFESCASGGGRIAYDFLQAGFNRVWLSDSNDALVRWRMQTSAATFLPSEVMGSHVGPRVCHTSGRILPMQFRAWVAASRHMGFEMDPRELTDEEAAVLQDVTHWYKDNRDWMHTGVALKLPNDDPACMGEIQISNDGDRFVVMQAQMRVSDQSSPRPVRLTGLETDAKYRITLRNPQDAATVTRGKVALRNGSLELSGASLMRLGVQLPCAFPATMWIVEGKRL